MTELHDMPAEPEGDGELFLDFANTVELTDGIPDDAIGDAASLRRWLLARSLIGGRTSIAEVERALPAFHELRDAVRATVTRIAHRRGPGGAQLRRLNAALREGVHHHELRLDPPGHRFVVRPVGDPLAQARSTIAGSLAHYLADHDATRLRLCANDGCRWLFVDRSPAGRRRWCDMRTCGNRAKVARHRARRRAATGSGRMDPGNSGHDEDRLGSQDRRERCR
jgi:predicted RNA-binding Zn ribbon-like protein